MSDAAIQIPEEISPENTCWDLDTLKIHLSSINPQDLLPPNEMPEYIDPGANFIAGIQKIVSDGYRLIENKEYSELGETKYRSCKMPVGDNLQMRVVVYSCGNPICKEPKACYPPEFPFLMPIMNYKETEQGRGRAMITASNDCILLIIRTTNSIRLMGEHIEPADAKLMALPSSFKPNVRASKNPFVGPSRANAARTSMDNFIETGSRDAGLAIYARRTYPPKYDERRDTILRRIDISDKV